MAEEFQGGVCGGTWWNHNLFSGSVGGGASGVSSLCSVAQFGGGYDTGSFGWPNDQMLKGRSNDDNNQVCDNNSLVFLADDMDSTLDILGFGLSPTSSTTDWNQQNFCKGGSNEENYDSLIQDNFSSNLNYGIEANSPTLINKSNFPSNIINNNQGGSPPMTMSNSSGDSSTMTCETGGLTPNFAMNSSASFLIQTLFDDDEYQLEPQQPLSQLMSQVINPNNYGSINTSNNHDLMSPCSWVKSSSNNDTLPVHQTPQQPTLLQLQQFDKFNGGMNNMLVNGGQISDNSHQYSNSATALNNIRASSVNSLQSRSRAPAYKPKSQNCATKRNHDELGQELKNKVNSNDQQTTKRPRIETPSSLPTFKVRKEKLGDRITALQQLVSPFGKTDTASVLHEAIEYIKFLHDQVHVLSTPYLKNGAPVQNQQVSDKVEDNEETNDQELRSRGLCLVPIASTYPVAQETPVDFWTPTFGGTPFR